MKPADCNNCDRKCKGNVIRDRFGNIKEQRKCPGRIIPTPMKSSLLERASIYDGWADNLRKIMESVNLRIIKHNVYPGFAFRDTSSDEVIVS